MLPRVISILVRNHNPDSVDIIENEHPVRCPGCGCTEFLHPRVMGLTYDIVCVRCRTPFLLQELYFGFKRTS